MKTVKEIQAIISKLSKQVKELEDQGGAALDAAKKMTQSWKSSRFADTFKNPEFEKWQELHNTADAAHIKADEISKVITVWRFNLLHAKKAELLPLWAGVLKEYEGKQIGAAREKEIREKLHALGIGGYFSKYEYSSPKINIAFLNAKGYCSGSDYIELTGDYNITFWDAANKFMMPDLSGFKFYGENTPYIENPKAYIKQLERLAAKAKKAAAEYDKVLRAYNAAAVPGFRRIDSYEDNPASIADYFRIIL